MVYSYKYAVITVFKIIGNIKAEGGIAVFPFSDLFSVYINGGIHIYTVKNQYITIVFAFIIYKKMLLIPAAARFVKISRIAYQPVVRYLNIIPMNAVKHAFIAVGCCQRKLPVIIE